MTQYLPNFTPVAPTSIARPVQDESAAAGISGAKLPDGRGILVWPNGGRARFAIVSSPSQFIVDDVVPSADMQTAVTMSGLRRTAVYNIDDQIYITVNAWTGSVYTTAIYKADNPSNPTTWTHQASPQVDNTPGSWFGTTDWGAGVPIKLASGRWVLGQGGWEVGFPSGAAASGSFSHAWYSDGGAAGPWVRTLLYGHPLSGFPRTEWTSPQMTVDPLTGYIYFSSFSSTINAVITWRSTDSAASWSRFDASNGVFSPGAYQVQHVLHNGQVMYGISGASFVVGDLGPGGALTNTNTNNGGWSGDVGWTAPGADLSDLRLSSKILLAGQEVFGYLEDQVFYLGGQAGGWVVGAVGKGW